MIFFILVIFAISSPKTDFMHILAKDRECNASIKRLYSSSRFLRSKQNHSDPKHVLLATSLLLIMKEETDINLLQPYIPLDEIKNKQSTPTPFFLDLCTVFHVHPSAEIASTLIEAGIDDLWLHPCLPLFTALVQEHPHIWPFIVQNSQDFPNANEIQTQLKRFGSSSFLFFVEKLPQASSFEEIELLHDIIWGLSPPDIPQKAWVILQEAQKNGPLIRYKASLQKEFIQRFRIAIDSLLVRFSSPKESRVWTPKSQVSPTILLEKQLCFQR